MGDILHKIKAGGKYELLKDKHGLVIGAMDGVVYKEYELDLKPGDKLLLYTDGVAEATRAGEELFGTKRMLDACAPGGGFVMDCSIVCDHFKEENFNAWYETTLEYGKY